ncbi:hypothetical protein G5C51_19815 [Streptomyces sp. A7024]|uniref:Uncharacterized protein n=1 Tax=Streptomyces coryli TaxID=1128680 RepID=A0A6G4U4I9_9ACTN|nr:hypothetical protein [Streptomyces coryli]NGN66131.1 hypothetical protein [Streptomyces coryli]
MAGTTAALLAAAAPAMATGSTVWTGGGRGLTAESAIQGAIDDATVSASGVGQFHCELVGEPQVFETFDDPNFGHIFRAQVTMACE